MGFVDFQQAAFPFKPYSLFMHQIFLVQNERFYMRFGSVKMLSEYLAEGAALENRILERGVSLKRLGVPYLNICEHPSKLTTQYEVPMYMLRNRIPEPRHDVR